MKENNLQKIRKFIAFIVLIIFVYSFIKLIPTFMTLTTETGRLDFQNNIENLGMKGPLFIIFLEICKIILIFLPGEPIELLAGMCYGPFWGLAIIYIGITLSNILIIGIVKKFGTQLVRDTVSDEKINKIQTLVNNNPSKADYTLLFLYFLPALPKDLITYVASLLPISKKNFLVISIIGRFPAVFSSVLVGSRILYGDIKSIVLIYAVTYIISGILATIYQKNSKQRKEEVSKKADE